jgi:hypothetical protein
MEKKQRVDTDKQSHVFPIWSSAGHVISRVFGMCDQGWSLSNSYGYVEGPTHFAPVFTVHGPLYVGAPFRRVPLYPRSFPLVVRGSAVVRPRSATRNPAGPNPVTPALPHMDVAAFPTRDSSRLGRHVRAVVAISRHHENFTGGLQCRPTQRLRRSRDIIIP